MADTDAFTTASDSMKTTTERFTVAGDQAFREGMEKTMASLNDINAQSRRTLEAMTASAGAAAKGAESLGAQAFAFGKTAMERHVEAAKALSGARSLQEVIELQTAYAKTAMESYITEMNRATEVASAAVKEVLRPLNERATAVVETIQAAR